MLTTVVHFALRGGRTRLAAARGLRHAPRESQATDRVRKGGLEPPQPFGYRILSPARLPIPPLSRGGSQRA
jgi:hypothetical protein